RPLVAAASAQTACLAGPPDCPRLSHRAGRNDRVVILPSPAPPGARTGDDRRPDAPPRSPRDRNDGGRLRPLISAEEHAIAHHRRAERLRPPGARLRTGRSP